MPDPDIRVRVGLDHDPDDPALVYTDITDRVHYGDGGGPVEVTIGRQDESGEIRPTEMRWAVRNGDNRFTPNNAASDLYGKWEQGRRVQIAEIVGGEEFVLGTGFLEIPEMLVVDPRSSQPVTVSAVDRMGRLDSAPPFLGNLTEYVRNEGGGTLVEHIPLTDPELPVASLLTPSVGVGKIFQWEPYSENLSFPDMFQPASIDGPPGDDARYPVWAPILQGIDLTAYPALYFPADVSIPTGSTVVALSLWVRKTPPPPEWDSTVAAQGYIAELGLSPIGHIYIVDAIAAAPPNEAYAITTARTAWADLSTVAPRYVERSAWRLVTVRADTSTGRVDLWIGADLALSATGTPTAAPQSIWAIWAGDWFLGSIGQIQVRAGGPETFTHADHLAQHRFGYLGLHRQSVAERITTLAGWAGVPASEVDIPAACSTPMQALRLAGRSPAEAIRAAAATGQDTLITTAAGHLSLIPRSSRYDQPVTMQIPWGWIGRRGLRYRPDRPVTDVTVSRTGGGTVRRTDAALARRYGVRGASHELDTAVDADAANLATWTLANLGRMRVRCSSIIINMMWRTLAERKALLRLKVGDRIELTGMPAGSPEDVPHLIVQGIRHTIGPGRRRTIEFRTSPLLGPSVGVPPPGARVGTAVVGASTVIAY